MDENPYKSPLPAVANPRRRKTHPFLRLPTTLVEWVVIVLVGLAIVAMLLPNVEEGREASRKRLGPQYEFKPESSPKTPPLPEN